MKIEELSFVSATAHIGMERSVGTAIVKIQFGGRKARSCLVRQACYVTLCRANTSEHDMTFGVQEKLSLEA